jgi:hypothetical protein
VDWWITGEVTETHKIDNEENADNQGLFLVLRDAYPKRKFAEIYQQSAVDSPFLLWG